MLPKSSCRWSLIDPDERGLIARPGLVGAVLGVPRLNPELTKEGVRVEILGPELRLATEGDNNLLSEVVLTLALVEASRRL